MERIKRGRRVPIIPFYAKKFNSCQSPFTVKSTGLLRGHFDCSNALFCVSFEQLKVCEVKVAPVHFGRHFGSKLTCHYYSKVWKCYCWSGPEVQFNCKRNRGTFNTSRCCQEWRVWRFYCDCHNRHTIRHWDNIHHNPDNSYQLIWQ